MSARSKRASSGSPLRPCRRPDRLPDGFRTPSGSALLNGAGGGTVPKRHLSCPIATPNGYVFGDLPRRLSYRLLFAADAEGVSGRIFNVSAGAPVTVDELAETIGRLLGKPVERRYLLARAGDLRDSWADVSAARDTLGYEPTIDFEEGLRRTAAFLLEGEDARGA